MVFHIEQLVVGRFLLPYLFLLNFSSMTLLKMLLFLTAVLFLNDCRPTKIQNPISTVKPITLTDDMIKEIYKIDTVSSYLPVKRTSNDFRSLFNQNQTLWRFKNKAECLAFFNSGSAFALKTGDTLLIGTTPFIFQFDH